MTAYPRLARELSHPVIDGPRLGIAAAKLKNPGKRFLGCKGLPDVFPAGGKFIKNAERIDIELKDTGEWFELTIGDDGKGFLPLKRETSGMGLGLMQHRASLIGASLDITSQPGNGTRVICRVPKKL